MIDYRIRVADIEETEKIYSSFLEAYFPENELKPLESILRMHREGRYTVIEMLVGEMVTAVACMTAMSNTDKYLLDYLAVHADYRSMGLGSALLKECTAMFPGAQIYIESEAVELAENEEQLSERQRRFRFYEVNGCRLTGVRTDIFDVIYDNWILSDAPQIQKEIVESTLREMYTYMIPIKELYDENVFIPYEK